MALEAKFPPFMSAQEELKKSRSLSAGDQHAILEVV
jgi:hypothetical protein